MVASASLLYAHAMRVPAFAGRATSWSVALGLAVGLMSACTLDRSGLLPNGDGSGAAGGSSSVGPGGSGGQGVGGMAECTSAAMCPGVDDGCTPRVCAQGVCGTTFAQAGATCNDGGGDVCDGMGNCVKSDGQTCAVGSECLSGFCADGVCCDGACDQACESCNAARSEGVCSAFAADTDPETECGGGVCDGSSACASGGGTFAVQWGDGAPQAGRFLDVDANDDIVVLGGFYGSINITAQTFNASGRDLFLARLMPNGTPLWSKQLASDSDAWGQDMELDAAGNALACGYYFGSFDVGAGAVASLGGSDAFLAKFDSAGNVVWDKRIGGAGVQRCAGVSTDAAGNVFAAFELELSADFGGGTLTSAGSRDVVVAKYDPTGGFLWATRYGDLAYQDPDALAVDSQGNVIVFGNYLGQIDFGGGALVNGGADEDLFVAKLDSSGAHVASARYGGSNGVDIALAAVVDGNDDIILGGSFFSTIDFGAGPVTSQGSDDAFVVKLDGQLGHLWSHTFGDASGQATYALAVDAHDNVVAIGDFLGPIAPDNQTLTPNSRDVFVVKYAASGEPLWAAGFGGPNQDRGRAVATQSSLEVVVTGSFETSIDFGSGLMTSAGGEDAFLAILNP